jgi:hypothetical protein
VRPPGKPTAAILTRGKVEAARRTERSMRLIDLDANRLRDVPSDE